MAQFLQELLVDAAYAGLSLHQITLEGVELHIHIIIYVIECTQEWRQIRLLVGVHHDADVFWHHAHVYLASFLLGVAIEVNHTGILAEYLQVPTLEAAYLAVLRNGLAEELDSYLWCFEHIERLHHSHIHQPVTHACMRSDIHIVAILTGIGTGDEKGFELLFLAVYLHLVGVWLVLQTFLQRILYIGK